MKQHADVIPCDADFLAHLILFPLLQEDRSEDGTVAFRQFFQNRAGHFETAFRGLVRIGGGADRYVLTWFHPPEFLTQQVGSVLLDIDLLLEVDAAAAG